MITFEFLATVVILSTSGVLGPGPLFVTSTIRATKLGWRAGVRSAIGHTIFEAPLVFGLAIGLSTLLTPSIAKLIGIPGGSMLLVFGSLQVYQAATKKALGSVSPSTEREIDKRSGVILGIVFTGANPFFLIWWLTIGSTLIVQAIALAALVGVLIMFAAHIWMDYAWLGGTAHLAFRGRVFLGKWYRGMLIVFGVAMWYFGITFILSALS